MANTKIRGNTQIIDATIEDAQIAAAAAIAYGKLNLSGSVLDADLAGSIATAKLVDGANFVLKDGSVILTGNLNFGTNKATNLADGTVATDGATKGQLDTAISGVLLVSNMVYNEVPSGLIDSSNTIYTLANTPQAGTVRFYKNGQRLIEGATEDYTISGGTITMANAPKGAPGQPDTLIADYIK
jgi:hypothetical protein